jgi:hypothetical protein
MMSRGPGYIQRNIFRLLMQTKKPMTFAEILAHAYPPGSFESDMAKALGGSNVGGVRSLRRALHKMVKDGTLTALRKGGRAAPHRYYIDDMLLAMVAKDKAEYEEMTRWSRPDPAHTGELLLEARGQMADKEFCDWIKQEFKMSLEQAEQFIETARQTRLAPKAEG